MNNINKVFMAFGTGRESVEATEIKRYRGIAPVYVLAVNPNKAELEKIYDTELEKEPEYIGTTKIGPEGSQVDVPQVRVDFIVKTDPAKTGGIDIKTKISFFVAKEYRYNKDKSKVQVINKYGETTWLPIDDAKAGRIPENLSWFEPADFRPAFIGEEELIGFVKAYLNIPNKSYRKKNGEVVELPDKSEAEARLDNIVNYFKGDFSELRNVISLQPNNKVKCLFGVKTTSDNKQYQTVYNQMFLKNNVTDYSRLDEDVQNRKNAGSYSNVEFKICDLEEYRVEPTDFESSSMGSEDDNADPWKFGE